MDPELGIVTFFFFSTKKEKKEEKRKRKKTEIAVADWQNARPSSAGWLYRAIPGWTSVSLGQLWLFTADSRGKPNIRGGGN